MDSCHICGGELSSYIMGRRNLESVCKKCGASFSAAYLILNNSEENYSTEALEEITGYKTSW